MEVLAEKLKEKKRQRKEDQRGNRPRR